MYELFNKPDIEEKAGPNAVDKFNNKKGIIVFEVSGWGNASGHFTLWDGKHLIIQEILIMMIPILFIIISI